MLTDSYKRFTKPVYGCSWILIVKDLLTKAMFSFHVSNFVIVLILI
jgi:hypothetical protein